MHAAVMEFVKKVVNEYGHLIVNADILEIGALNVNGTIRDAFNDTGYAHWIGVDYNDGDKVDYTVKPGEFLNIVTSEFDVVVSTSALEHDPYLEDTLAWVSIVLKSGGVLILTVDVLGKHDIYLTNHYNDVDGEWLRDRLVGLGFVVEKQGIGGRNIFIVARRIRIYGVNQ